MTDGIGRVLVTGSRSVEDWEFVRSVIDDAPFDVETIIHGNAPGVDQGAEHYFRQRQVDVDRHPIPQWVWEKIGRKAGPIRNGYMVEQADAVIAIWDGESSGTKDAIAQAESAGLPVYKVIVDVDDGAVADVVSKDLVEDDQADLMDFEDR